MELLKCSIGGVQYGTGKTEIEIFQEELAREQGEMPLRETESIVKPQEVADLEDAGFDL